MRPTHNIMRKAGASLLHSVRTAEAIGSPLNTFVTINYWQVGVTAETIFHEFAAARGEWFQRWSAYNPRGSRLLRNGAPTYAYVHEASRDKPHTHWLLHVKPPNKRRFALRLQGWLQKRYGLAQLPERMLDIRDADNPEGAKLYMAKALDKQFAEAWGIWTIDDGVIFHRRADTSRNIGPSVWQPLKQAYKRQKRAA